MLKTYPVTLVNPNSDGESKMVLNHVLESKVIIVASVFLSSQVKIGTHMRHTCIGGFERGDVVGED